ncbi:MAG TPA: ABC transporter permease [Coriobacteriia bacterium]|jgi:putative ABC transport system permease protein
MLSLSWAAGLLRRRPARILGTAFCIALGVALLASLGAFFSFARAGMTRGAIAGVPADWQVQLSPGADATRSLAAVASFKGVSLARPVAFADVPSFEASAGGAVQTTGQGKAVGIPPAYAADFPGEVRFLLGAHDGVLLAQQTAANLHADVGSTVLVARPGLPPVPLRVDGVVDLPSADSLFQTVGAPPGAGATAPPDNVVLLPLAEWHRLFDPVAAADPAAVVTQVHVRLRHDLPPDPSAAFQQVLAMAHNLEARFAGNASVGDNLAAQLDGARADAIYSELLFVFLGLPGVILGALIAFAAAASSQLRRRREQGLLRLRGATPRQLLAPAVAEASVVGVLGVVAGLAAAAFAGRAAFGSPPLPSGQALAWWIAAAAAGVALALAAIVLPALRDARDLTVKAAAASVEPPRAPLWSRLYLDVALLAAAGVIYWESLRNAYQVVLVPEGVPTISVDYLTLLAPMMLWLGAALLSWRLSRLLLTHGRRALAFVYRPFARGLSPVVTASMSRQESLISRGLVIVALTASFAVSVAVFNTTYANQARVDAELTNGADVSVQTPAAGLPPALPGQVRGLPGVEAVQPMQHRLAYVGNDLQDLFGIDPRGIGSATPMSDAFFQGGNAAGVLGKLAATPDGILVAAETVNDFQLQPGDLIRIRLQSAKDRSYHVVPFHYVGIAKEFPTAPHDSFLVANAGYVARATGSPAFQTLLVKTNASPPKVAAEVRGLLGPANGAKVSDIVSELKVTLSALTAVDLSGLTRLELAFAVVLVAAASGLFLILGYAERRRMFAIATALGARSDQLAAFVWGEALFTTLGGIVLGATSGFVLSAAIVNILTGVFDPPPERLFVPWGYLGAVLGVAVAAVVAAGLVAIWSARRPSMEVIRDL